MNNLDKKAKYRVNSGPVKVVVEGPGEICISVKNGWFGREIVVFSGWIDSSQRKEIEFNAAMFFHLATSMIVYIRKDKTSSLVYSVNHTNYKT